MYTYNKALLGALNIILKHFTKGNWILFSFQDCVKYMQEDEDVWSSNLLHFHLFLYPFNLVGMIEHQSIKSICLGKKNLSFTE